LSSLLKKACSSPHEPAEAAAPADATRSRSGRNAAASGGARATPTSTSPTAAALITAPLRPAAAEGLIYLSLYLPDAHHERAQPLTPSRGPPCEGPRRAATGRPGGRRLDSGERDKPRTGRLAEEQAGEGNGRGKRAGDGVKRRVERWRGGNGGRAEGEGEKRAATLVSADGRQAKATPAPLRPAAAEGLIYRSLYLPDAPHERAQPSRRRGGDHAGARGVRPGNCSLRAARREAVGFWGAR